MSNAMRLLWLVGLATLAAAALALPASASVKGYCVFESRMQMAEKTSGEGMQVVGGEGKFSLGKSPVSCMVDSNKDGVLEVHSFAMVVTGWYDTTVCGTAKLYGVITSVTGAGAKVRAMLEQRKFSIEMAAFQGIFKWHDEMAKLGVPLDKVSVPDDEFKDAPDDKSNHLGGHVLFRPSSEELPVLPLHGECVRELAATGTIVFDFDS